MDNIKRWASNGEVVRQVIELGKLVPMETASRELTDEFLLFTIASGSSICQQDASGNSGVVSIVSAVSRALLSNTP